MTPNGHSEEPKRSVYGTCDPHYLRTLREAAGMDMFVLARTACLSVAQVRQLESDDSDGLFYSDAIKRQAYKRLLMILGAEPPSVEIPEELRDAAKVADAHLTTLDQIVAMSEQPPMNHSAFDAVHAGLAKLREHKQATAALLLLVAAVTLFVLHGPQSVVEATSELAAASPTPKVSAVAVSVEPPSVTTASVPVAAVAAASASVAAASALVAASPTAPSKTMGACTHSNEAMPQLSPFVAQKEGKYVYLVSAANAEVCVVDGNKQATLLQLKAGENRSVYGVSPWQVSSTSLQKVQIFFQGGRVSLPDATVSRVQLVEMTVAR
ncbi:hypothetical protein C5F52_25180 [Limnohabitans sp. TS-CS-82]|uniref:helix-turn-helix domain-containing protein n=1 Tax=Limnohabitans sp. TS-CS-82 TaxID=2094193 RepID=UPI000CF25C59|nr:helix-turn-helix domain-containing protein [Limnohabitans sp. TS-CS-82]PQA80408.1 hypothetical protein C5F52_25180 [Limnohabitans sp. TS-CS-82]